MFSEMVTCKVYLKLWYMYLRINSCMTDIQGVMLSELHIIYIHICIYVHTHTHTHTYLYILEKEMITHSNILAWEIPWPEEPGGLQSTGSQKLDTTEQLKHHLFL